MLPCTSVPWQMVYILMWKPVSPVDIIDISAMVTRQGTCTPPHWIMIWSRDACSQGSKFMYWLSHGSNIYSSLVPRSCPGFRHLQNNSFTWHIEKAWERDYMYGISAKLVSPRCIIPILNLWLYRKLAPKPLLDLILLHGCEMNLGVVWEWGHQTT